MTAKSLLIDVVAFVWYALLLYAIILSAGALIVAITWLLGLFVYGA